MRWFRVAGALCLAVGLTSLAMTGGAAARRTKPSPIRSCRQFSTATLARYFDVGRLTFKADRSNVCTWTGERHDHYRAVLQIGLSPGSKSLWQTIRKDAQAQAKRIHGVFRDVRKSNPSQIEVDQIASGHSLSPCPPGHTVPSSGPPHCSGDPSWYTDSATAYGKIRHRGAYVIVSAGTGFELGDGGLHNMVELTRDIMSGKV